MTAERDALGRAMKPGEIEIVSKRITWDVRSPVAPWAGRPGFLTVERAEMEAETAVQDGHPRDLYEITTTITRKLIRSYRKRRL